MENAARFSLADHDGFEKILTALRFVRLPVGARTAFMDFGPRILAAFDEKIAQLESRQGNAE